MISVTCQSSQGIAVLNYRYKSSDGPVAAAKNDEHLGVRSDAPPRAVIPTAQRTDAVSGTDFTLDDLVGFDGWCPSTSGSASPSWT